jgi:muramoyltetrapeptide carboxypeptidase
LKETKNSIVRPLPLRAGDRVGIVAPASAIDREHLLLGCEALRRLGYEPVYEDSILDCDLYFAGTVQRRARELTAMFAREDVRAILCARGGYGCNYLLPHIDIEVVRRHPKIFAGYSDVTTLLTWFHDAAGMVTFHAPMVAKDFAAEQGVDISSWQAQMTGQSLPAPVLLSPLARGNAEGVLYGGCLSMLVASLGTPYEIATQDKILLIEDVATKPYQIDRMLMQLRLAGKLNGVRGIVFGPMRDCDPPPGASYTLQEVLRHAVEDLRIPVAFGVNSGHVECGNITLALGVRVSLAVEEGGAVLKTLESAVGG